MARPTINDVARAAGVSKKTVSRVINHSSLISPATRDRVQQAIAELDFVPDPRARALALGQSMLVALIHDGSHEEVLGAVIDGLEGALVQTGHALVVHRISPGGDGGLARFLAEHRPAGLVILPLLHGTGEVDLICTELQTVWIGADEPDATKGVKVDERAAMACVVDNLVACGHVRIALVSGPDDAPHASLRELGYLDAMADHGLDRGPLLIEAGDFSCASGRAAAALLFEVSPRPTAVIAINDAMAAGVLQAARDRGLRVPRDLSVAGFGDSPLAQCLTPPLGGIAIDWRGLGRCAVSALFGPPGNGEAMQLPRLVNGATIGPPAE